jgi:polysaccharide pyruvyl transferase WcaK-like protein
VSETANRKTKKICFFGHFGSTNFGNEITLHAILCHLRRVFPEAEFACICSGPEVLAATQRIEAVPISWEIVKPWNLRSPAAKLLRRLFVGVPAELCRWLIAFHTLKGTDVLIIPGTGLLTDAYGLLNWGPYNLAKWTLVGRLRGCKVLFVSVGAGPLYGAFARWLVKSALRLAEFRSYRDKASMAYLQAIGFRTNDDRVFPDLVFSLPENMIPHDGGARRPRRVVGLGLMGYAGRYSVSRPTNETYRKYLDALVTFAGWLLAHDYDIRFLLGEAVERTVTLEFRALLAARFGPAAEERVVDHPAATVEQLLPEIAGADIVVATRFHNVLLALLLGKPAISISFHHKCVSLMSEMGMADYCHDINHMDAERLIEQFQSLEGNAEKLRATIKEKVEQSRKALDEQYSLIFNGALGK